MDGVIAIFPEFYRSGRQRLKIALSFRGNPFRPVCSAHNRRHQHMLLGPVAFSGVPHP